MRAPHNEAVFAASEASNSRERLFWGSNRPFNMHIVDKKQQEVLTLRRKLGYRCFCLPFSAQTIEIWSPPGILLGFVREAFTFFEREYRIFDQDGQFINTITIPFRVACCISKEANFKVNNLKINQAII